MQTLFFLWDYVLLLFHTHQPSLPLARVGAVQSVIPYHRSITATREKCNLSLYELASTQAQKLAHIDSAPESVCNDRKIVNDSMGKSITDAFCSVGPVDVHFNDKFSSLPFELPQAQAFPNSNIDSSQFMDSKFHSNIIPFFIAAHFEL